MRLLLLFGIVAFISCKNHEPTNNNDAKHQSESTLEQHDGWKCITDLDNNVVNKMAYATEDNFLKEQIYPCAECWLRSSAAEALLDAQAKAMEKGYRIVLFDCYRPTPLQKKMFDVFPDPKYVADPKKGSIHNKGCAVDVSLAKLNGDLLDMGTEFDDFSEKAHPDYADLSPEILQNRKTLTSLMLDAGFEAYKYEWWHFNFITDVEYENDDFLWTCE